MLKVNQHKIFLHQKLKFFRKIGDTIIIDCEAFVVDTSPTYLVIERPDKQLQKVPFDYLVEPGSIDKGEIS